MSNSRRKLLSALFVNGTLAAICLLWLIPTFGLFISSFRTRDDILTTGWWTIFPHRDWVKTQEFKPDPSLDPNQPMQIAGVTGTFDQFRAGVNTPDGRRVVWLGNKRAGVVQIQELQWTTVAHFTTQNYQFVLTGAEYEVADANGNKHVEKGDDLSAAFLNSVAVTVPSVVIPVVIAAFAAYGFAWMRFPGRKLAFTLVVALLVVPLQIALIPVLHDYVQLRLNGTYLAIWLAHTGFGLPLAIYLLYLLNKWWSCHGPAQDQPRPSSFAVFATRSASGVMWLTADRRSWM